MKFIYLDNASTTRLSSCSEKAMRPYFEKLYGNPHSLHFLGQHSQDAVEKARESIACFLGCDAEEIFFTSGGTESNNLALNGSMRHYGSGELIVSNVEHPSVLEVASALNKTGFGIRYLPVDRDGIIKLDALKSLVNSKTRLISVMHVNNQMGAIQPIESIGRMAKKNGILFHCDASQSFGKLPISFDSLDLLTLSAHKFGGPKGVGVLFVRSGVSLQPLLFGGGQEKGLRSGTLNVPGIVGMAAALPSQADMKKNYRRIEALHRFFARKLESLGAIILGCNTSPYILCAGFIGMNAETLVEHLNSNGICISRGSACSEGTEKPNHVLLAMNVQHPDAYLRFSFSPLTTRKELEFTISKLRIIIAALRSLSTLGNNDILPKYA